MTLLLGFSVDTRGTTNEGEVEDDTDEVASLRPGMSVLGRGVGSILSGILGLPSFHICACVRACVFACVLAGEEEGGG